MMYTNHNIDFENTMNYAHNSCNDRCTKVAPFDETIIVTTGRLNFIIVVACSFKTGSYTKARSLSIVFTLRRYSETGSWVSYRDPDVRGRTL